MRENFIPNIEKLQDFGSQKETEFGNIRREIFHVSGWEALKDKKIGDEFVLFPGTQGAEGKGIYFSEQVPRFSAAEGSRGKKLYIISIKIDSQKGWFHSKGFVERKFNRPRTYHS